MHNLITKLSLKYLVEHSLDVVSAHMEGIAHLEVSF